MKKIIVLLITILGSTSYNSFAQNPKAVYFERQDIVINDFTAKGFILDIGGGGEGVIGQLKGDQVISIDPYKDELVNAPSTNLKIVMDGRDLKFLDNTFNTVAVFYTMMYISGDNHAQVFQEAKRVLKHGGKLLIWDVNLPVWKDTSKHYGIYRFTFKLPKTEINTGYGARFPKKADQDMKYYIDLAKQTGFKVTSVNNNKNSFFLELKTAPAITDTLIYIIDKQGIANALIAYEILKQNHTSDFYFGADALIQLSNDLLKSDKAGESVEILKLAIKEYNLEENKVNSFGYKLLNKKLFKESIEIFKLNVDKFPQSSNSYDSLAEAYMLDGQNDLAVKNYQKSLELNPNNQNAVDMLIKLKDTR